MTRLDDFGAPPASLTLMQRAGVNQESFSRLTNLTDLHLVANALLAGPVLVSLPKLISLDLYQNRIISSSDLSILTALTRLTIKSSIVKISNQALSLLVNLTELDISSTSNGDEAISGLTRLNSLDISSQGEDGLSDEGLSNRSPHEPD